MTRCRLISFLASFLVATLVASNAWSFDVADQYSCLGFFGVKGAHPVFDFLPEVYEQEAKKLKELSEIERLDMAVPRLSYFMAEAQKYLLEDSRFENPVLTSANRIHVETLRAKSLTIIRDWATTGHTYEDVLYVFFYLQEIKVILIAPGSPAPVDHESYDSLVRNTLHLVAVDGVFVAPTIKTINFRYTILARLFGVAVLSVGSAFGQFEHDLKIHALQHLKFDRARNSPSVTRDISTVMRNFTYFSGLFRRLDERLVVAGNSSRSHVRRENESIKYLIYLLFFEYGEYGLSPDAVALKQFISDGTLPDWQSKASFPDIYLLDFRAWARKTGIEGVDRQTYDIALELLRRDLQEFL